MPFLPVFANFGYQQTQCYNYKHNVTNTMLQYYKHNVTILQTQCYNITNTMLQYVTRSEKTYHFAQKLKKRCKQKSRKKSFFNTKLFLAYLKIQLLGYLLAKFQHLKRYSFAKRAAQRELLLFSSRGRLYVNGN